MAKLAPVCVCIFQYTFECPVENVIYALFVQDFALETLTAKKIVYNVIVSVDVICYRLYMYE